MITEEMKASVKHALDIAGVRPSCGKWSVLLTDQDKETIRALLAPAQSVADDKYSNPATLEAMADADAGKVVRHKTVDALMADLNAPDRVTEICAKTLTWWENFDELHRQGFVSYIDALPHSVGNYQARYTVKFDQHAVKWDCCFWVGNMGHPLLGKVYSKPSKEEAFKACQYDFNQRVSMMVIKAATTPKPCDKLNDAVDMIGYLLPLAKGYVAAHTGIRSTENIIEDAERMLSAHRAQGEK